MNQQRHDALHAKFISPCLLLGELSGVLNVDTITQLNKHSLNDKVLSSVEIFVVVGHRSTKSML